MTYVAYEPEPPMLNDTILAFQRFTAPSVGCRISADPKGPVNRIISLVVGDHFTSQRVVKSVLWHVPAGAEVKVTHEPGGGYTINDLFALRSRRWEGLGWRALNGIPEPEPVFRAPGWYIEIDGQTVLYATDAEIRPAPTPEPQSRLNVARNVIPATRRAIRKRLRTAGDAIAHRFGYMHEDEAGGW